ncbi:hypothetical protein ACHAXS_002426, partial [Conticribra weissflogii]
MFRRPCKFHVEFGGKGKTTSTNSLFVRFHKKPKSMMAIMIFFLMAMTTAHANLVGSSTSDVKIDVGTDNNVVTGALVGCPAPAWDETGSTDYHIGDLIAHTDGNIYMCKNRK